MNERSIYDTPEIDLQRELERLEKKLKEYSITPMEAIRLKEIRVALKSISGARKGWTHE